MSFGGFGSSNPPAFGSQQPTTGFSFGATTTAAPPFGTMATTTASTGFQFGSTPAFGSTGFGATQPSTFGAAQPTFGATPPTQGFGATQPAQPTFGAPTTAMGSQPTFGAAPAFGAATTTPSFGAPAPTAAPTFGATQPAPAFGATTGFGAAQPSMFGTTTSASTGMSGGTLSFGAPQTTQPQPSFGLGTPSSGLTLGTAAPASSTGFGFGLGATTTSAPTLSFGAPTAPTSAGLSFGAATTTSGFNLSGLSATTTPSLSFGTPTTSSTTGISFGATTPATTATTGFSLGLTPSTAASGLSFGTPTTTTAGLTLGVVAPAVAAPASTASTGMLGTLGASAATPSTTGFSLGLGGKPTPTTASLGLTTSATTSTSGFTLGGAGLFSATTTSGLTAATTSSGLSTATSTTTVGLGGVDSSQSKLGLSGQGAGEPKNVKDQALPPPIHQTFTELTAFIKKQKTISADIAHSSAKPFKRVQEDIEGNEALLADITSGLARSSVATEKLKSETAQGLFYADMAQRLREDPSSLSYECGPEQFFADLITRFETDGARLQHQVETAERHLRSITQSSAVSPQEVTLAARRLHDTMVALAAHVQSLHLAVKTAEQDYAHIRQVYLKEDAPVPKYQGRRSAPRGLAGPTPFSESSGGANLTVDALSMLTGATLPGNSPAQQGWLGSQTSGSSLLGSPNSSFFSSPPVENSTFNLSKPPVGNKRNKR